MKKLFGLTILSLSILFIGTQTAGACTCSGRPQGVKGVPTCGYYWRSEAVFIGLAEKITIESGRMKVSFSVEKSIRGVNEKTVEVFTSANGGTCGYPFKEGERYFVYSRRREDGKLTEDLCGPTVLLKDAEDDLEYVKEIESGKFGSRISGTVYEDKQRSYDDKRTFENLAGIEITIKNKKNKFKTKTDEKGFYIFKEIPPGVYRVIAEFPQGLREIVTREDLIDHFAVIYKDSIRCDGESFVATRQGSIRGKVVGNDGQNPPQQRLSLFPLDENDNVMPYRPPEEKWANRENGEFFFNVVPAGKYLLSINPNNCPYPTDGFPTMLFPGVADKSDAKIITINEGEQLRLADFRILPLLKERWFSGVALYADKTPAANVTVSLIDGDMSKCNNFHSEIKTDELGRFRVKGYETYQYQIRAFTEANRQQNRKRLFSKPVQIPQLGKVEDIELILDISL